MVAAFASEAIGHIGKDATYMVTEVCDDIMFGLKSVHQVHRVKSI